MHMETPTYRPSTATSTPAPRIALSASVAGLSAWQMLQDLSASGEWATLSHQATRLLLVIATQAEHAEIDAEQIDTLRALTGDDAFETGAALGELLELGLLVVVSDYQPQQHRLAAHMPTAA